MPDERDINWVSFDLRLHLRNIERDIIETYLRATNGNKTATAILLQVNRPTLLYRLKVLGMSQWIEDKRQSLN